MPFKPKKPCSYPGCPELTDRLYCPEHQRKANRTYEKYKRDTTSKKRYNASWQKIRKAYATSHPFCEECLKDGRFTPVEHVHHILPLADGGTHDQDNLMSLCKSCHSRIHAKMKTYWK